jgi:SAM-dependent methyltransferase
MDHKKELITILEQIGPERIRRPIYDNNNQLLAEGIASELDGNPDDFSSIDFSGKTVVDLGCNFGFYSILAKQKGASHVLGMDLDNLVIKGAELLRDMYGISGVEFVCGDFTDPSFSQSYDITLLVDFFGKGNITQGIEKFLDTTERFTREGMIISARNHYRIEKHFNGHLDTLKGHYSSDYIRNGRFYLIEYVADYFKENWNLTILSSKDHDIGAKKTLYFQRK